MSGKLFVLKVGECIPISLQERLHVRDRMIVDSEQSSEARRRSHTE